MAAYIPFINSKSDLTLMKKYYSDAPLIRVPLEVFPKLKQNLPPEILLWIDSGVDIYHRILEVKDWPIDKPYSLTQDEIENRWPPEYKGSKLCKTEISKFTLLNQWKKQFGRFDEYQILADQEAWKGKQVDTIRAFVNSVLKKCASYNPKYITVPVLPMVSNSERNSINRTISTAVGEWKTKTGFRGEFVLPMIFTHQDQLKGKTQWANKLSVAQTCYDHSGATIIWAVDSELDDQMCRERFPKRFRSLIDFHEDIRNTIPGAKVVAGPYWGMNLVLWVRGLCDYPAIGMGGGYQYSISGGFRRRAVKVHVALEPLRRWATVSPELKKWLRSNIGKLDSLEAPRSAFEALLKKIDLGISDDVAKTQVATVYKGWLNKIARVPPEGRALVLYQDLSSAFVLGRQLSSLPRSEAPGRDPAKVAEQLMLHCL